MKEIIAQIINQLNRITHSNIISHKDLQANLTSLSNLLNIRYVSYWTFNQSKYLTSKFRLFTLGLLFLMVSILNGISGEFFLFLLVFEFVYSNTVKLFNFIVINSLNDFIISYTNETLLLKIILKNVNEFEAYLITLINDFKSLLINQKTNTGLKKKYVKKSFNNYILLNKKLGKLIEVTGQINAYHIQSSKKIISLELKAKRVINQYIKRAKKQYFNIEKNMNKFTKRKVKNMNQVFFATTIILGNTANTIIFTLKTIMGKLKDKCNLKLKEVNSRVTSNDFSNNIKVEWAWIVVPSLMIVDVVTNSSDLIYFEDKPNVKTNITLLGWAKANQWYWSYQYANISKFVAEELMQKTYDSYLVVADLLEMGTPRLLLSINEFIQPSIFNLKLLLTSVDVIHSFALAQIGSKIDALPGRINQIFLNFAQLGLFLGQCSELCGFSHGFMPITKSILIVKGYFNFLVMGFSGQTLVKNMLCDLYEIKTHIKPITAYTYRPREPIPDMSHDPDLVRRRLAQSRYVRCTVQWTKDCLDAFKTLLLYPAFMGGIVYMIYDFLWYWFAYTAFCRLPAITDPADPGYKVYQAKREDMWQDALRKGVLLLCSVILIPLSIFSYIPEAEEFLLKKVEASAADRSRGGPAKEIKKTINSF